MASLTLPFSSIVFYEECVVIACRFLNSFDLWYCCLLCCFIVMKRFSVLSLILSVNKKSFKVDMLLSFYYFFFSSFVPWLLTLFSAFFPNGMIFFFFGCQCICFKVSGGEDGEKGSQRNRLGCNCWKDFMYSDEECCLWHCSSTAFWKSNHNQFIPHWVFIELMWADPCKAYVWHIESGQ